MEYLTFKGELIDNIIATFSKLNVGGKFTPNTYSIVSHAYETAVTIKFDSKLSVNVIFLNSDFSYMEIIIRKFLIYRKYNVLTLSTKKEFNHFNMNRNDIVVRLYNMVLSKFDQLGIDYFQQ